MTSPKITIYGRKNCADSDDARLLCRRRRYSYDFRDVAEPAYQTELAAITDRTALPQILVGVHYIGGIADFNIADARGILQQILGGN